MSTSTLGQPETKNRALVSSLFLIAVLILVGVFFYGSRDNSNSQIEVNSFENCVKSGQPVMESFPRQCRSKDGVLFVEDIPISDFIKVSSPVSGSLVSSPLTVSGEARGNWYFEASFPVKLYDIDGNVLASAPAQAESNPIRDNDENSISNGAGWMTTDFVPFKVTLEFEKPVSETGVLVLSRDNPSGLPEYEKSISIPVLFGTSTDPVGACIKTGCSSQICSDKQIITDCQFRPVYSCYQAAKCERQIDGQCGFTQDAKLQACLLENKN